MTDHDFMLRINGEVVYSNNSNVSSALRSEITGKAMKAYQKSKYQWTDATFEKIDWNLYEKPNVHKLCYG